MANLFTDKIVVNSKKVKEFTEKSEKLPAEKVISVYNCIKPDRFNISSESFYPEKLRNNFGIREGQCVITMVGKFKASKGHELLIKAAKKVLRDHPCARFILVGAGPLRDNIERAAKNAGILDNIIFAGEVQDVRPLLLVSDMCVLSSVREGLANALLEYMAAGKAIVVTDAGANDELIKDGVNGLVVPRGDAEAFSRAIGKLIDNMPLREELGRRARASVKGNAEFTCEYMTERYNSIYKSLLEEKK